MSYLAFLRANWLFLSAGILMTFGSSYGQTFFISLFAAQIKDGFGLTDGGWGMAYTVATTASAIVMVWAGALTDRFRVRVLARFVMVGLAVACLMMTQAPGVWWLILTVFALRFFGQGMMMTQAPGVWWLILTVFALRFFGQGMMSHLAMVAMARWFVATRGKALSVATLGFSFGTAFVPILIATLLLTLDWRILWIGAAGLTLLSIPLLSLLLRFERTPQSMTDETQATGMGGRHWTRGEVMRHPVFWLLIPALLGPPAWGTALGFHQVHLADVKGWSFVSYVAIYPFATAIAVASTFGSGWAIDRLGSARVLPFYMLPFGISFLIMWQAAGIPGAAFSLAVFAIGQGFQSTLASAFWAEFFGTRHIGSIKAVSGAIMVFGSAIGPGITGVLIDVGLTFPEQMPLLAAYFAIAALLTLLAARHAARSLAGAA